MENVVHGLYPADIHQYVKTNEKGQKMRRGNNGRDAKEVGNEG